MGENKVRSVLIIICAVAACYFAVDFPLYHSSLSDFGAYVGFKSFLTPAFGILFGWAASIGCVVASTLTGLIYHAPSADIFFEQCCVAIMTLIPWIGWHLGSKGRRVQLKKGRELLLFLLLLEVSAALCGLTGMAFGIGFTIPMITYGSGTILAGIPMLLLMTSVICARPLLPPGKELKPDGSAVITEDMDTLGMCNETLEEEMMSRGFKLKNAIQVESCIEELVIRYRDKIPDCRIEVSYYLGESISLFLNVPGERYFAMKKGEGETDEDLLGLTIICHQALRVSYSYFDNCNHIHIVI